MTRLAVAATLGITSALVAVSIAGAQGPDVRIAELHCDSDPEFVVIVNQGDASQQLAAWQLQSDPASSEVFDLRNLGTDLLAGESNTIQSGPSASGAFVWTADEVFRDGDPTDYARIVDDTGAVVHEVNCAGAAAEPSPTPTPEPSPANGVPDGGGPPPVSGGDMAPLMMVLLGGSMAAAGLGAIALPRLRLRSSPVVGPTATLSPREAVARPHAQARGVDDSRGEPISVTLGLTLMGLLAAAVLLVLWRRGV